MAMRDYHGIYRGVVTSNTDFASPPHRLTVAIPQLTAANGLPALPSFPTAASQRVLDPPEVGEGVWVMFENGDLNYPVYTGFFGGSSSKEVVTTSEETALADHSHHVNGVYYVTDYGAKGDGITDDSDAIEACIQDAGRGALVFFPRGQYLVSRPVVPLRQQILEGVYATKYQAGEWPSFWADCAIIASDTFEGDGVIVCAPNSYGVHIERLAIIGPGHDFANPNVAGIRFPSRWDSQGETAWVMRDILVNSCPDAGITGHMWVVDLRDVHLSNCGWGFRTSGDDGLLDARIIGCNIYFNRNGGIVIDGGWTGAIDIVGCRVERSGNKYGYPAEPLNPDAPGLRIRRGQQISITNVNTDANTGHGIHIGHPTAFIYNIVISGCAFKRDGGGTQQLSEYWKWVDGVATETTSDDPDASNLSIEGYAGIFLQRCFLVRIVSTISSYGGSDDSRNDGPISPTYGLWAEDSGNWQVAASVIDSWLPERATHFTGDNYLYKIDKLGESSAGASLTLEGSGDDNKSLSFRSDGVLRWQIATNPTPLGGVFAIWRADEVGDYVDTPFLLSHETGGLQAKHALFTPSDPDRIALAIGAPAGQTTHLLTAGVDGLTFAGIKSDGRMFGTAGVAGDDYVTMDQLSGGSEVSDISLANTDGDGLVRYEIDGAMRWSIGHNPSANGNTFYLGRYDALGDYVDDPMAVNLTTGRIDLNYVYIRSSSAASPALVVRGAEDSTALLQEWIYNDSIDGQDTVAGVRSDGRIWGSEASLNDDFITLGQLKAVVAASTDFADFQARVAAL